MYKVRKVDGGWSVFWIESPDIEPRLIPHTDKLGNVIPYSKRQAAYRRCKHLNDALEKINAMVEKDGAIIL